MFRFKQTIIREPTVCALLKLQYWHQLKYFVIELFGRVAAYAATRPPNSAGRIMSMKNSNDTIGNRTRNLPTCSVMPQPTALPRAPIRVSILNVNLSKHTERKSNKDRAKKSRKEQFCSRIAAGQSS